MFDPPPPHDALRLLSPTAAHLYAAVPLRKQGEMLLLAVADEMEEDLRTAVGELTGCFVKTERAALDDLGAALARFYPDPSPEDLDQMQAIPQSDAAKTLPAGYCPPLPPVARLCRRLIVLATDPEVASIFLMPQDRDALLRTVNHDGSRLSERLLTSFLAQQVVRQMKIFTGLEPDLRAGQRGVLPIHGLKRPFTLVVETIPSAPHESVRVEVLD